MTTPRVRTDDPDFSAKVKRYADDIRRSLAAIEQLMHNAESVARDFADDLERATYTVQDAAARAARLATPKVRPK
jgi:hypothetical protein